jgi:5'-3' exonuclease
MTTDASPSGQAAGTAPRHTLALDSPSLIYRAFFAVPSSLRGPGGEPVNAVRGYLDMVGRLLTDQRPARVVHVLDADWRPAWRVDAWPGYKANRPPDPPELPGQFPIIEEVLAAAGMPEASAAGFEADDVLGTLAAKAVAGRPVAVVTGDRDLFQVVRDPVVWVLFPRKGVADPTRYDEAAVEADYGVPASRYADFAILRGDPSDGLPGIRGIGAKTAAKLIAEFASLDDLEAAADTLPPRQAAAVRDGKDYLDAMRGIVPVRTDVRFDVTPAAPPDHERLRDLAARYAIESPVRRLEQALAAADLAT